MHGLTGAGIEMGKINPGGMGVEGWGNREGEGVKGKSKMTILCGARVHSVAIGRGKIQMFLHYPLFPMFPIFS